MAHVLAQPHVGPLSLCRQRLGCWLRCLQTLHVTGAQFSLQCSVSCGVGTQRRKQLCQRLTAKGRRVPLSETMCRDLPGPPLVRSCQMSACSGKYVQAMLQRICSFCSSRPMALFPIKQHIANLQVKQVKKNSESFEAATSIILNIRYRSKERRC